MLTEWNFESVSKEKQVENIILLTFRYNLTFHVGNIKIVTKIMSASKVECFAQCTVCHMYTKLKQIAPG